MLGIETTARASRIFLVGGAHRARGLRGPRRDRGEPRRQRGALEPAALLRSKRVPRRHHLQRAVRRRAVLSWLRRHLHAGGGNQGRRTRRRTGDDDRAVLAAGLFILQTYIAALLVGDRTEFVGDSATNDAFYTVSALVGGPALKVVVAVAAALSAAIANALVAQAATARLLFAMARDGQLPRALAHVHPVRRVPERALLFVAAVSLVLGLFFVGQVGLLSSLVNFGALFSFLMLHVSVIVFFLIKRRTRTFGAHRCRQ